SPWPTTSWRSKNAEDAVPSALEGALGTASTCRGTRVDLPWRHDQPRGAAAGAGVRRGAADTRGAHRAARRAARRTTGDDGAAHPAVQAALPHRRLLLRRPL